MSFSIAADGDLKAGPVAVEIGGRRRAALRVCFLPLLFVFIGLLLCPSIPQPGVKEKKKKLCPFGAYWIKEEVNIISITFEPVNQQRNADKHYCKRLTVPMRQELSDLPLCQRGGKPARTWRR